MIGAGAVAGAALVAALAPIGTRLRVPSIVAARAALGLTGAQTLALLLFVTNFAWIALNNVIAASICVRLTGLGSEGVWATAARTPRHAHRAGRPGDGCARRSRGGAADAGLRRGLHDRDRPRAVAGLAGARGGPPARLFRGFDVVAGYQVSWLLMFADYPRFVRSAAGRGIAVFLGLALTALWFMPLGLVASIVAGSADPGAMVFALGLGWWGAVLLALATLTTNFVNIYMSALAFKSLRPAVSDDAGHLAHRRRSAPRSACCRIAGSTVRDVHAAARRAARADWRHPAGTLLRAPPRSPSR